jgi:hypothetical protein
MPKHMGNKLFKCLWQKFCLSVGEQRMIMTSTVATYHQFVKNKQGDPQNIAILIRWYESVAFLTSLFIYARQV